MGWSDQDHDTCRSCPRGRVLRRAIKSPRDASWYLEADEDVEKGQCHAVESRVGRSEEGLDQHDDGLCCQRRGLDVAEEQLLESENGDSACGRDRERVLWVALRGGREGLGLLLLTARGRERRT